jgi:thiol-disulfide isomerase/thioredoxin
MNARCLVAALLLLYPAATMRAQQPAAPAGPATPAAAPAAETYQQTMAREQREHPTLKIGSPAPDFSLKGIDDRIHTLAEYKDSPFLAIAFISNHCPASQLYEDRIKAIARDYAARGVKLIAIAPNGPQAVAPRELNYSMVDDSFESMKAQAEYREFNFPYLFDGDTQQIAHQYGPKVTPHIFIFDQERKLRYEGRIDDNMRGNNIKSSDARNALDALVAGRPVPVEHTAVFGCSTKWNAAMAGKQREMNEWRAKPVTLEVASLDELKKLRTNPTGKTLMINFWATWCGPCQTEYPELLTSYLWYRSRDFEFVSVALNAPAERVAVEKFLNEHHSAVRNLMIDTEDVYAVQAAFDPTWESGVPFTIVLAPDGKEIYRVEGEADILALRRKILGNLPDAGMFAGNTEYWQK